VVGGGAARTVVKPSSARGVQGRSGLVSDRGWRYRVGGGTAGSCRVVRGGSFINNEENARAAIRNHNDPHNHNHNNGVRVAAAHFFPGQTPAGNVARPRSALSSAEGLGDRGFERKHGLFLAAVAGSSARANIE
jgi:hypothetical protein